MKVVCIEKPPTSISISIEVGEIFDAFGKVVATTEEKALQNLYVKDKLGNIIPCDVIIPNGWHHKNKYFITLEEWREKQLSKIL